MAVRRVQRATLPQVKGCGACLAPNKENETAASAAIRRRRIASQGNSSVPCARAITVRTASWIAGA